jgi:5,6-dimethylbenzimidazole synthase
MPVDAAALACAQHRRTIGPAAARALGCPLTWPPGGSQEFCHVIDDNRALAGFESDALILAPPPPRFDAAFRDQLAELIAWRRDVRNFRIDPIAQTDVLALLELAQHAPSVGNSQPWRFIRIRSAALRRELAEHVDGEAERAASAYSDDAQRDAYRALPLHGLRTAPEVIAVFCDEATPAGSGLGVATMPEARAYSVVLAIHTLWLAACAKGIALGWVSILDPDHVTRLLETPPAWKLIALLCLGLPEAELPAPELERRGWQARLDWRANVSER